MSNRIGATYDDEDDTELPDDEDVELEGGAGMPNTTAPLSDDEELDEETEEGLNDGEDDEDLDEEEEDDEELDDLDDELDDELGMGRSVRIL